ncbi:MAG: hypothetical protein ACHQ2Y_04795 [Candidatus Lutacidiplasmatales archaeon]
MVGGAGSIVVVILIMVLSSASGGLAHPAAIVIAPYKGSSNPTLFFSSLGCTKWKVAKTPSFNLNKGHGGAAESASASSCKGVALNYVAIEPTFEAQIKIPFTAGIPVVYANGSYSLTGRVSFTTGHCVGTSATTYGTCERIASIELVGSADLIDKTTGARTYSGTTSYKNETYLENYSCLKSGCNASIANGTSGPLAVSGSFSWVMSPGVKMARSHQYFVEIVVGVFASVEVFSYHAVLTGAAASVSANFATLGNGMTLNSIVVT